MLEEQDNGEKIFVKPTTGLTNGELSKNVGLEKQGFVFKIRRALSGFARKMDTNPESKPPLGKAF